MDASTFRDIVSGRRRGLVASTLRLFLHAAEFPYAWEVARRNRRFDTNSSLAETVDLPVISVGNITLGGTGKTPMVAWLARLLQQYRRNIALVSRGYGARSGQKNDEALELERLLPGVLHFQNPRRVEAARRARRETDCSVVIADDAFQHRRLARDLDIVLLDALEPFGYEHVFPRGTLREPLEGLARADVVLLSRADLVSKERREAIRARARELAPAAVWGEVAHRPAAWITPGGDRAPLGILKGRRVGGLCGIGNPQGFRGTLERCGVDVACFHEFPDHHHFTRADMARVEADARTSQVEALVCTLKDLVKISPEVRGELPLYALEICIEFLSGQPEFETLVGERLSLGPQLSA